jgi:predicted PurR-regulated permease PerM
MENKKADKIEISHRTVIFIVFFLIGTWFIYYIKDIIFQLFVALVISSILYPTVKSLTKYKVPKIASILLVYLLMFTLVGVTIAALVPTLINQTTKFVNLFPNYLDNLGIFGPYSEQVINQMIVQLGMLPSQFAKVILSLFSNVLGVVTVLIFSFYLLLFRDRIENQLEYLFGKKRSAEVERSINVIEKKLGGWARGQLALMFLIWGTTYIGLYLLGIPFALPLSILAGFLEIIPIIGPLISAIPAVIIGFGISPIIGIATAALYFLIQQLENYIFVPKVMEKSVGVNPVITLLALAIGFRLAGIIGILMSIPAVITIQILGKEYLVNTKN